MSSSFRARFSLPFHIEHALSTYFICGFASGLVRQNARKEELMYVARELNPAYPGIFDLPAWNIGSEFCKPTNPECSTCYLNNYIPKLI